MSFMSLVLRFLNHLGLLKYLLFYPFFSQSFVGLRGFSVWIGYFFILLVGRYRLLTDLVVAINFFRICLTVNPNDRIIQ